jgi:hypothetical protein
VQAHALQFSIVKNCLRRSRLRLLLPESAAASLGVGLGVRASARASKGLTVGELVVFDTP